MSAAHHAVLTAIRRTLNAYIRETRRILHAGISFRDAIAQSIPRNHLDEHPETAALLDTARNGFQAVYRQTLNPPPAVIELDHAFLLFNIWKRNYLTVQTIILNLIVIYQVLETRYHINLDFPIPAYDTYWDAHHDREQDPDRDI